MNDVERPPRRRRFAHRWWTVLVLLLGLASAAYVDGLFGFARQIPAEVADPTTETDVIVVLTGGSSRLVTGFQLLAEGRAPRLLITGVNRATDLAALDGAPTVPPQVLACCVTLGYGANDTIGNAAETAAYLRDRGLGSLRLVTASYHLQRSLLEFGRAMPGARIVPHPVFPPGFIRDGWWRWPGSASLVIVEFNKFLAARLRHVLAEAITGRPSAGVRP
jgi:uncharacterized SAM-binding protein YcdF (DUF218 family)